MLTRQVTVASASGLHARPAKIVAQTARVCGAAVRVAKGDKNVNAASILSLMTLGAYQGDVVEVQVEEVENAPAILDLLCELIETDLDHELPAILTDKAK
ncbi:MAG: HPr family phosphocarrier protein [Promicromonosporaceae bacterium]|nr:HPr family phosphocarrier protein [Promicromonosporaceae bacterium]